MTDPRNAQPGSYGTSGYGAGAGDESRMAANSGRASVRPNRPRAASPAGWFPPPAGEAAPPVRHREPARSDGVSPYDMEARPTSMYRVPWRAARSETQRSPGTPQTPVRSPGTPQTPAARPSRSMPDGNATAPDLPWPSLARQRPRHIPVVGPTEALRGRAGGPGMNVPPGAVPGLLDQERRSGWQLAQRVWQDSGVSWEDTPEPAQADRQLPDPYASDAYSSDAYMSAAFAADSYAPDSYPADADAFDADAPYLAGDPRPAHQYSAAPYAASRRLTDPHPTRPDLPVLPESADSRTGMGPWPVQQPVAATRPEPYVAERRLREPGDQEEPEERDHAGHVPGARGLAEHDIPDQEPAGPAAPDSAARKAAPQAPPLPRRIRRASEGWTGYPPGALPGRSEPNDRGGQTPPLRPQAVGPSAFAPSSPFAPSPAFASLQSFRVSPAPGTPRAYASPPLSAPVASPAPPLGEPDELFRAWQGSVRDATATRTPWAARRPPARREAGPRGRGWQVAKIGVPAAVIVTVGAGALMMLTGRANEMLAERASTGALSSGQPSAGVVSSGRTAAPGQAAAGVGLTLAGYPGEHGTVSVAAMWSAGGTTMAVGYADTHPAVWRHAADGTWSLVSAVTLGGLTGHLTSVAQGSSGWIAVGSVSANGAIEPVVFWSPDGVTWTPQLTLTDFTGSGTQFLGVTAGPGGYLVVGKQGSGNQARVGLWWSADLKNWVNGDNNGAPGSFAAAAVAVQDGFVAVGSENNCHTIWTSPDGRNWTARDLVKPSGATTAALSSAAVTAGGRFAAAGSASTSTGDIPIVVTSADAGTHVTQVVLGASGGPATVTAVTATSNGFVAVGLAGPAHAQRAVEWTSPDGLTWSAATPVPSAGTSEITALTDSGTTVAGTAQRQAAPTVLTLPAR